MLDDISRRILHELTRDGRLSFRELGARVGLSAPAVTERVRRLERDGVITGYTATVDPAAVGSPILVIMRIIHATSRPHREIGHRAAELPEVIECNRVTGAESHVIRAWCRSISSCAVSWERSRSRVRRTRRHGERRWSGSRTAGDATQSGRVVSTPGSTSARRPTRSPVSPPVTTDR